MKKNKSKHLKNKNRPNIMNLNNKSKKAIIVGELFIYILAVVVFSMTVYFGFKAINTIIKQKEQIDFVSFKISLEREIKEVYSDFGTITVFNERNAFVGEGLKRICFVDTSKEIYPLLNEIISPGICNKKNKDYNFEMCDSWKANEQALTQNIFTDPRSKGDILIETKFLVDGNGDGKEDRAGSCAPTDKCFYLCIDDKNGRFDFSIEGRGKYALIKK